MKHNKYKARRTKCLMSHIHASRREATRCNELCVLERAGKIRSLINQPIFKLFAGDKPIMSAVGQYRYVADFEYECRLTGKRIVEDVKGYDTPLSKLKRAIFEAQTGIKVTLS